MTAKDLKNALLQEAVQGKLVPQIASEGNARDLLEEIRKERLSHGFANSYGICDGKCKKTKKSDLRSKSQIRVTKKELPEITEDEIPFEIPESWCWCRLGEISTNITAGGDKPSHFSKTITEKLTVPVISNGEKDDGVFGYTDRATVTEKAITVSGRGNIGFTKVRSEPFMPIVRLITITFPNILDFKYLEIAISFLVTDGNGSAVQQLTVPMIKPLLIPFPPLAEQKRIVAAIEKFMPLIEEYGKKETELKAFNEQIGALTKKAILQEAVQGKLVPQITGEGNAKDLLEEIKKEKAKLIKKGKLKKEKPLPEITEDEIPFDTPEHWCWCRLGDLSTIVTKGTTPRGGNVAYSNEGIGFLRAENVAGIKDLDLSNLKYIDEETHTNFLKRSILNENDLLITIAGTLGRTAIVKKDNLPLNANQAISIVRLVNCDLIYLNYLVFSINSPELQKKLIGQTKVTAIPNLTLEIIENCLIPIPPLEEQKRIVAAIEKMLPLCEKLGE